MLQRTNGGRGKCIDTIFRDDQIFCNYEALRQAGRQAGRLLMEEEHIVKKGAARTS
jgi:hypothetical protein